MQQPGKLNMKDYTLVTDAISRMNLLSNKEIYNSNISCAPLATPENVDLGSEFAQVCILIEIIFKQKTLKY